MGQIISVRYMVSSMQIIIEITKWRRYVSHESVMVRYV